MNSRTESSKPETVGLHLTPDAALTPTCDDLDLEQLEEFEGSARIHHCTADTLRQDILDPWSRAGKVLARIEEYDSNTTHKPGTQSSVP